MKKTTAKSSFSIQMQTAATKVTKSRKSACFFLKSAGIMTPSGKLSSKFK